MKGRSAQCVVTMRTPQVSDCLYGGNQEELPRDSSPSAGSLCALQGCGSWEGALILMTLLGKPPNSEVGFSSAK